ncbi:FkbM family methyltransferase [Sphingomonas yunnanensis]|uniref:FkbM family methyltransferase n=1 Tax=Sphingomonas yunnanensis TaxID=310400 RepID=UPI001CA65A80|nr:FkbM family methyltransferase [Sphingomonas yunnanensis]MBY9063469.1 FkbM family methyltransferase [Sphingomonas yunnanensis]
MKGILRQLGRLSPDIRYVRAISTRVLTPIHHALGYDGGTVDVLGSRMTLDPRECVDNRLWFQPHLYDREERAFVVEHATPGVFLDVGANIGFWSLFLARQFAGARVVAIEANPKTADILRHNVAINGYDNIEVLETGVGPERGDFDLYLNTTGNRGGDSFVADTSRAHRIKVEVERLSTLIERHGIGAIEFMKIDVEGMEEGVFTELFVHLPRAAWPRLICVETLHSPNIAALLERHGYAAVLTARENSIFRRSAD